MTKFKIYPYHMASGSAAALAEDLECLRILPTTDGSRFRGGPQYTVINWGNSHIGHPGVLNSNILNHPSAVRTAVNKIECLKTVNPYGVLFTTNKTEARIWADGDGNIVMCRTTVTGRGGEGIVIATNRSEVVDAPLYTRYMPNRREYRVHVMHGEVIDITRKARRRGVEQHPYIWNHANGYVYMRGDLEDIPLAELGEIRLVAKAAIRKLGLDFGGVDMIFNTDSGMAYVLEVNTAPGLEGTTLQAYSEGFRRFYDTSPVIQQAATMEVPNYNA